MNNYNARAKSEGGGSSLGAFALVDFALGVKEDAEGVGFTGASSLVGVGEVGEVSTVSATGAFTGAVTGEFDEIGFVGAGFTDTTTDGAGDTDEDFCSNAK